MSDNETGGITIAIAGNPNCGKTSLFNALTGSRQRVGNWPGVTVEYIEGSYRHGGLDVKAIDLPGIYSFSAHTLDEKIAREYILKEKPDVVVNIVDATNLERNLYLTTQLLEMKVPVVVAVNMVDLLKHHGLTLEVEHLEKHLGCTVIPTVAVKKKGITELRDAIAETAQRHAVSQTRVAYDSEVEETIDVLQEKVSSVADRHGVDSRWLALKLLERDEMGQELSGGADDHFVGEEIARIERHTGDDIDTVMTDGRYGFIHGLARDVIQRDDTARRNVSDAIDRVVLNRLIGIPVFLAVMYVVFLVTMKVGEPFIHFFDILCGTIFVDGTRAGLETIGAPQLVVLLLADGVGGGIQTVATLIPPIFFIFACLSILEDSGYMARAAFVMDRLLRRVGLPGKAFLPLLIGFGCNVPAILATRTLENKRDRTMTVLINPFMSCGARFPVYTLFAVAFFPRNGTLVIFSLYFIGVALAILTGLVLKKTLLAGEPGSFVMELPPYHVPTFSGIMHHTWHRLEAFVLRAGKIIIMFVIVLSVLNSVGTDGSFGPEAAENSVLGAIGKSLTPAFRPMGITDRNWPAVVGLFSGIFAKEAVVGTLDALYTQTEAGLRDETSVAPGGPVVPEEEPFSLGNGIAEAFTTLWAELKGLFGSFGGPTDTAEDDGTENAAVNAATFAAMREYFGSGIAAFAYMLFVLTYVPCVATLAAIYREVGFGWAAFSTLYLTGLAWLLATMFFQLGTFAQHPGPSALWLLACVAAFGIFYAGLKIRSSALNAKPAGETL